MYLNVYFYGKKLNTETYPQDIALNFQFSATPPMIKFTPTTPTHFKQIISILLFKYSHRNANFPSNMYVLNERFGAARGWVLYQQDRN